MGKAFMIAGGGVSAKTVEAIVHLCAAGWGPEELHILIVDPDTQNGNLTRAVATIKAYNAVQCWPWTASSGESGKPPLDLFRTQVFRYDLSEPIESMNNGGLAMSVYGDPELSQLLELLYDEEEQTTECLDGFRARPNLGCLVLADHIQQHLKAPKDYKTPPSEQLLTNGGDAKDFISKLNEALVGNDDCPVAVVGSVFGGMGASLHPIIEELVSNELKNRDCSNQDRLCWSHVLMLPYFMPKAKKASVDPNRYLLDTSMALQFYDLSKWAQSRLVYLVGAFDPGANGKQVEACLGSSEQKNPPFVEEVVGALAVLQFIAHPHLAPSKMHPGSAPCGMVWAVEAEEMKLNKLPGYAELRERRTLGEHLVCLLHLAAFFLRTGEGQPDNLQGLYHFLPTPTGDVTRLRKVGWYEQVLTGWAGEMKRDIPALANVKGQFMKYGKAEAEARALLRDTDSRFIAVGARMAADYFGRLLFWADKALAGADARMVLFGVASGSGYASIHDTMCRVAANDIQMKNGPAGPYAAEKDNAMGRIIRAALAAILREHEHGEGNPQLPFALFNDANHNQAQLLIQRNEISIGIGHVLGTEPASTIFKEYRSS